MRIVLDSNDHILGLDTTAGPCASSRLLEMLLIAAFADHMNVDYVVSENRHIYRDLRLDGFTTLTAEAFLDLVDGS